MSRPVVATPISPPPSGIKFEDIAKLTDGLAKLVGFADKHLAPIVKKALPLVTRSAPAADVAPEELTPEVEVRDWYGDTPDVPVAESFDAGWMDLSGLTADWWG